MAVTELSVAGFEHVLIERDGRGRPRSIVVVHDTTLGPALGGVRLASYPSADVAIEECLALARAMTLKMAVSDLELGGGWSLLIGEVADKSAELLRAHGRVIATLGGRFIPVNDVGTDQADLAVIGEVTAPVCAQGDPSPWTALGVAAAIRACARHLGQQDLTGLRIGIQGAGRVGTALAELLAAEGAVLAVADVRSERAAALAARTGASVITPDSMITAELDVFAPCALGGIVDRESVAGLRCRAIAGGANNVLATPEVAVDLQRRGIVYAPDFCANAGGVIFLQGQLLDHDSAAIRARVLTIGDLIAELLVRARDAGITTTQAAVDRAHARLAAER
ncbi:Glu/Leu/Phe/Val dehydrogenase family protein [Microlunatus speluncae]|uniref:Glu/Leu/Phe/Val dehydrogenase family protein n=1 Tax=Microlunatus speluncae TaxID=2594267 RepID=UPI0012664E61|nr:Glu/Leu/Phe/Val dehydrogenase family protein [Microlunatus speluncae]